jgi:hypothetical protein
VIPHPIPDTRLSTLRFLDDNCIRGRVVQLVRAA